MASSKMARNCVKTAEVLLKVPKVSAIPLSAARPLTTFKGPQVTKVLEPVINANGLFSFTPNIEYLIGTTSSAGAPPKGQDGSILDIADKTSFVLQSKHPVRYLLEREIRALETASTLTHLKYLDWVAFFGRSLLAPPLDLQIRSSPAHHAAFEDKLRNISTAAEYGMFSSEVHQTVVDITARLPSEEVRSDFNIGNKYAVLVGDFFAIKVIYFAEKVKSSPVFLRIVEGVEEFTTTSFVSNMLDQDTGYPLIPSKTATFEDWARFAVKVNGYFTGGLRAAHTFISMVNATGRNVGGTNITGLQGSGQPGGLTKEEEQALEAFVTNLALAVRGWAEVQEFEKEEGSAGSPFAFASLPAVLFQREEPEVFQGLRKGGVWVDGAVQEVREKIARSSAIPQTVEKVQVFANRAHDALLKLHQDQLYTSVLGQILRGFNGH